MVSTSDADVRAPVDSDFVGIYNQGRMESLAQVVLLDDHTFCYALMAGNLDLIKAGRWKAGNAQGTIDLEEIRPDSPVHPAVGRVLDRLGEPKVGINFDGHSLSGARSPVFAVTRAETPPATFRPLFGKENSRWSWARTYALPLMDPGEARYFFIGDIEVDFYERPKRLRVTQYAIGRYDTIRIGFDRIRSEPPLRMTMRLAQDALWMGDENFGTRKPLTPEIVVEVREHCINPALRPDQTFSAQAEEQQHLPENEELLTPIRTIYLDVAAIAGRPFFTANQTDTPATDSLKSLVESERNELEAAFKRAAGDIRTSDEFLDLAKAVAEKRNRINMHAPLLVKLFSELLVATNVKGDFGSSERIILHFKKNIYPATLGVESDSMSYGLSVIASQGLINVTKVKNNAISDFVFEKLLGEHFDIATHKNITLIYNLACYHALNNNKTGMLEAIKQSRRRGVPSKQFMDDPDFKNYWNDAEYLSAITAPTTK